LSAFEAALRLSPNYTPALKGEVQLLYKRGDRRVIPLLKKILQADPKDETAREMLALYEERQGNCQAAIADFALSMESASTHSDSLEAYGSCLVHTNQLQKAITVFRQLVTILPGRIYPKYDLAMILIMTQQDQEALRVLAPLIQAGKSDPDILELASEAYEAIGNTPEAVSLLRQAIVLNSGNADYYIHFAALCLDHESFQVGIDMVNAGLQRISGNASLFISRGMLYAQAAQYDKAEADFNTAEQLDATQSLSSYALGLTELQRNHPDQALLEIRTQLRNHPQSPFLHYLLAKLLMNSGSRAGATAIEEARQSALLAVQLKPDLVAARDILAAIYLRSDQYNLTIEQCSLALKYAPSDQSALYHLIIAMRRSGSGNDVAALVKRLSETLQTASQHETNMKRYKLDDQEPSPAKSSSVD
jgi:tetratricopeptide (TPR) repeat protein